MAAVGRSRLAVWLLLLAAGCTRDEHEPVAPTEPVVTNGMDALPVDTVTPQADSAQNPVGAAVTADGDPFGIVITARELDCLQPLDLDTAWNEDGSPVPAVADCLQPSTATLFSAWHRFEAEIAGDADDTVVACVDAALRRAVATADADDDTYPVISAECGAAETSDGE